MKKFAIFVEGQTELIFVREFLLKIYGYNVSFDCFRLRKRMLNKAKYSYPNPDSKVYFFIVDVGCDEGVKRAVKDQEEKLFDEGYEEIFCLRDMYSDEYKNEFKDGPIKINFSMIEKLIQGKNDAIKRMSNPGKVSFCFAIMEIEAWFLAFYKIFERIDSKLTREYIKDKLEMDLAIIDPEKEFPRPSKNIKKILELIDIKYDKSEDVVEKIVNKIEKSDMEKVIKNGKVACFKDFYEGLNRIIVCG